MTRLFSDAVINDVLDRSNIVEVVASYLPLKRAGRNYKACCPFHPEKTPSFIVSADKQIYHCFGCGAGGNVLSFVMQYEKVNFPEALKTLAQRSGIPLPDPDRTDADRSREDLTKNLQALYEQAAAFYHENLMRLPEGGAARSYLNQRGISKETAQKFRLGYATDSWDALLNHLRAKKVPLNILEKSGLVVARAEGGFYDRFRKRILFPVANAKGQVVAFGARVLDASLPKYINSPETVVYTKGKHLFGLHAARDFIRETDQAVVVEGYLDMIVPFEAGIRNIVASLGTALTLEQVRLIKRFTNNVVMLYDPDFAGGLATLRALDLLIKEDMDVRIACLPPGEDPDSFARKQGAAAFQQKIAEAKPVFDYKLAVLLAKYNAQSTTGKDRIVREMLPTIRKFKNNVTIAEYVKRLAEGLRLDEQALRDDLNNVKDYEADREEEDFASRAIDHERLTEIPVTERMLVKLMLEELHLVDQLRALIDPSDFTQEKLRKIVQFVFDFFAQGKTYKTNVLMSYLGDEEAIHIISELATLEIHDCPNKERLLLDCVKRIKRDRVLARCKELCAAIHAAQTQEDHAALEKLIFEYNALIKQRSTCHGETGR